MSRLWDWLTKDGFHVTLIKKKWGSGYHQMKLIVIRNKLDDIATQGEMFIDDTATPRECFTMEPGLKDPTRPKGPIPAGVFEIRMEYSPHFSKDMPHLQNVPGFQYIMIHPLNWPRQTEGCIGVGQEEEKDKLDNSDLAYNALLPKILDGLKQGKVFIEIRQGVVTNG